MEYEGMTTYYLYDKNGKFLYANINTDEEIDLSSGLTRVNTNTFTFDANEIKLKKK